MLHPSIQELLKSTSNEEGEKLNKYSLVMATAKVARVITNLYVEERKDAERKAANKETDKDISALITKEYRDEKAVKNALREINNGQFKIYLPGEEGYEDSLVEIEDYKEPERFETPRYVKPEKDVKREDEEGSNEESTQDENYSAFDDISTDELMGATGVFDGQNGFTIEDGEN